MGMFSATRSPKERVLKDGHVLGYLFFTTVLDEGGVDNIAVHPEARRQGIASAISPSSPIRTSGS